ncbi:MAG TPA: GNAT family N-acetyltransferase [Thermoanaerobaculia bacterium]|nr:GNAT family N-acetyltransferase [Thermoanaerobaculia bacterium]
MTDLELRPATADDIETIEGVMRDSISGISSRSYDPRQVASALDFVAHLDRELVDDGTYFVVESDGKIVACGGWSRRARLYAGSGSAANDARMLDPATEAARIRAMFVVTGFERRGLGRMILERCERDAHAAGFRRIELMAMLSGEKMYLACGYRPVENVPAKLEDGTPFPLTRMEKIVE